MMATDISDTVKVYLEQTEIYAMNGIDFIDSVKRCLELWTKVHTYIITSTPIDHSMYFAYRYFIPMCT